MSFGPFNSTVVRTTEVIFDLFKVGANCALDHLNENNWVPAPASTNLCETYGQGWNSVMDLVYVCGSEAFRTGEIVIELE